MDRTERLARARELVDALERGDDGAAEGLLHSLHDARSTRLLKSVGELTREVHAAFGGVVSDARLYELSRHAMPDARERLAYVVEKSEEAAHRTLGAVETLAPIAEKLLRGAPDDPRALAEFAGEARLAGERLKLGLTEILMAQEYQDLTARSSAGRSTSSRRSSRNSCPCSSRSVTNPRRTGPVPRALRVPRGPRYAPRPMS